MSRFWPNQKVTLRFILRNTYDPAYINWLYPGYPLTGNDATGLSDVGMAKVIVDDLHISTDECPVDPLPPLAPDAQPFEDEAQRLRNGEGLVDLVHTDPDLVKKLACVQLAVANAGSQLVITSAFRPKSYQSHLYEVHLRYGKLLNNKDPACAELRALIIDEEEHVHFIVRSGAAKADNGAHPKGLALDIKASGVNLVQAACGCGLYRPYPPDGTGKRGVRDPPHYEINPGGQLPCR